MDLQYEAKTVFSPRPFIHVKSHFSQRNIYLLQCEKKYFTLYYSKYNCSSALILHLYTSYRWTTEPTDPTNGGSLVKYYH